MKKIMLVITTAVLMSTGAYANDSYLCEAGKSGDKVLYEIADGNDAEATLEAIVEIVKNIKEETLINEKDDGFCGIDIPSITGSMVSTMAKLGKLPPDVRINVSSLQGGKKAMQRNISITTPYIAINIAKYLAGCSGEKVGNTAENVEWNNIVLRVWIAQSFKMNGVAVASDGCDENWGAALNYADVAANLSRKLVLFKNKPIFELLEIFANEDQTHVTAQLLKKPGVKKIAEQIKLKVDASSKDEKDIEADSEEKNND